MTEIKRLGSSHDTCPKCGSKDTFWGDSNPDPDCSSAYFHMECEGCGAQYDSVFYPAYQVYYGDEEDA